MPYGVGEDDRCPASKPWSCHKVNEDGSPGEVMGCHPSEEAAKAQQRALYANEPEPKGARWHPGSVFLDARFATKQERDDFEVERDDRCPEDRPWGVFEGGELVECVATEADGEDMIDEIIEEERSAKPRRKRWHPGAAFLDKVK